MKAFIGFFVGVLCFFPVGVAQDSFPPLENYQVTEAEIYWSRAVRLKLLSQPYKIKDFYMWVQAYALKDRPNNQSPQQLDRIRYSKYASEITGGYPELMISSEPDVQNVLLNRTVGTPNDFLIHIRRACLLNENMDVPIYKQANALFASLDCSVQQSQDELMDAHPMLVGLHDEQARILRDVEQGDIADYLQFSRSPASSSLAVGRLLPFIKSLGKAGKKHWKKAYKILKEGLDIADDMLEEEAEQRDIKITFEAPLHNSSVNIVLGDYYQLDPEHIAEQSEKLLESYEETSKQLDDLHAKLQQGNESGQQTLMLTEEIKSLLETLSERQLTKASFDYAIKRLEKTLTAEMDAATKKLLQEFAAQKRHQQRLTEQGRLTFKVCQKILKQLENEQKIAQAQYAFAIKKQLVGQSFALAANLVSLTGGSEDLVTGLTLAAEVVPEAMQAITTLSTIAGSSGELTATMTMAAFSSGLALVGVGLKIMSAFGGGKSADQVTHEYLVAISKQIRDLHKSMLAQFKRLDKKVNHLLKKSEEIYIAILENRNILRAVGDDLKTIHQEKYLMELEEKESYLQMMIETKTSMPNSKYAELVSFFATFGKTKAGNSLFVGYRNAHQREELDKLLELTRYDNRIKQPVFPIARVQDYLGSLDLGISPELKKSALQTPGVHPDIWYRSVKNLFDMVVHAKTLMQVKNPRLLRSTLQRLKALKKTGVAMNMTLTSLTDPRFIRRLIKLEKHLMEYIHVHEEYKWVQRDLLSLITVIQNFSHAALKNMSKKSDRNNPAYVAYCERNKSHKQKQLRLCKKDVDKWAQTRRRQLETHVMQKTGYASYRKTRLQAQLHALKMFNIVPQKATIESIKLDDLIMQRAYLDSCIQFLLSVKENTEIDQALAIQTFRLQKNSLYKEIYHRFQKLHQSKSIRFLNSETEYIDYCHINALLDTSQGSILSNFLKSKKLDLSIDQLFRHNRPDWMDEIFKCMVRQIIKNQHDCDIAHQVSLGIFQGQSDSTDVFSLHEQSSDDKELFMHPSLARGMKLIELLEPAR